MPSECPKARAKALGGSSVLIVTVLESSFQAPYTVEWGHRIVGCFLVEISPASLAITKHCCEVGFGTSSLVVLFPGGRASPLAGIPMRALALPLWEPLQEAHTWSPGQQLLLWYPKSV